MEPSRQLLIQGVGLQEPALGHGGEWPRRGRLRGGQGAADGLLSGIEHVTQCCLQPQQYNNKQYNNINLSEWIQPSYISTGQVLFHCSL